MSDIDLTQAEADGLLAMPKVRANEDESDYPGTGGKIVVPLTSEDRREHFLLDIRRGRIDLLKGTYQNRARQVVILARLDFGGRPHRNPDGEKSRVLISTSIARDTVPSGLLRLMNRSFRIWPICGRR